MNLKRNTLLARLLAHRAAIMPMYIGLGDVRITGKRVIRLTANWRGNMGHGMERVEGLLKDADLPTLAVLKKHADEIDETGSPDYNYGITLTYRA